MIFILLKNHVFIHPVSLYSFTVVVGFTGLKMEMIGKHKFVHLAANFCNIMIG